MNLTLWCALFIFIVIPSSTSGAKILGIFVMPTHSHYTLGIRLMKELASKGHEVTFINSMPQKTQIPNLREISVAENLNKGEETRKHLFSVESKSFSVSMDIVSKMSQSYTEKTLSNDKVQKLLKSNEKFDLVLIEYFWNEAFMAIATHFNCPVILLSPMPPSSWINHLVGNPGPASYVPNLMSGYTSRMSFFQRMHNSLLIVYESMLRELYELPAHRKLAKKYIPSAPNLDDILYNTSVLLVNSHSTIHGGMPLVPKMIEIGGYHVSPNKPLPNDLKSFIDNAKEGVVLFSMGSNLKSAEMPIEKRTAILNAFSKVPVKILWKFETDLPGLPPNVKIQQWLPQQDVLAHKNVKAFITHGGLLSTIETIYFGKPLIGIPIYGDQKLNMKTAVDNGYGISLPFGELNEERLIDALTKVLNDPKLAKQCNCGFLYGAPCSIRNTAYMDAATIHYPNSTVKCVDIRAMGINQKLRTDTRFIESDTLYANDMNITVLSPDMFTFLPNVKFIDMSGNKIRKLPRELNRLTPHLETFLLAKNRIRIPIRVPLIKSHSLTNLMLSNNKIRKVNRLTFSRLPNLKILYLDSNFLNEIDPAVFKHLMNLQYLHLGNNKLKVIPPINTMPPKLRFYITKGNNALINIK